MYPFEIGRSRFSPFFLFLFVLEKIITTFFIDILFFRRKSTTDTFIDGYLNRLFNDSTVPFIFEKIRHYADFYKCCFNKKRKDEIILVNNYGFAFKYKFNRIKEKEPLKIIQEEILFDEDEDDNEEAV